MSLDRTMDGQKAVTIWGSAELKGAEGLMCAGQY